MEHAASGDIRKIIQNAQQQKKPPPEELVWKVFIQIVQGLEALHSLKVSKPSCAILMADEPSIAGSRRQLSIWHACHG